MSVLGLPDGGISSGQTDGTGAEEKVWLGGRGQHWGASRWWLKPRMWVAWEEGVEGGALRAEGSPGPLDKGQAEQAPAEN